VDVGEDAAEEHVGVAQVLRLAVHRDGRPAGAHGRRRRRRREIWELGFWTGKSSAFL
jgi:hypothetical protein